MDSELVTLTGLPRRDSQISTVSVGARPACPQAPLQFTRSGFLQNRVVPADVGHALAHLRPDGKAPLKTMS